MLAETAERPFSRKGWLFEPKLDGYRVLAARSGAEPRLLTRNGNDCADGFPEVLRAVAALPFERLVLDGEVVALDDRGRPSFQRLQGRARLRRPIDIRHAAVNTPVTYYAFDLLGFEDFDLRPLPLAERKAAAAPGAPAGRARSATWSTSTRMARRCTGRPSASASRGSSARRPEAPYKAGPLAGLAQDAHPEDRRLRRRRLHRAQGLAGRLRRAAPRRVRRGRADVLRARGQRVQRQAARRGEARRSRPRAARPACAGSCRPEKDTTWVDPAWSARWRTPSGPTRACCGSRFSCASATTRRRRSASEDDRRRSGRRPRRSPRPGRRRTPSGRGASEGGSPTSTRCSGPRTATPRATSSSTTARSRPGCCRTCANRPVVMTRYPDGIGGKSFFQKDAPGFRPELDPDRADVERGHPAGDRLLRLRRRGLAALHREPGHHPAAPLGQPGAHAGAARLVRARSRSQGRAVRARGAGGARRQGRCATGSTSRCW